MGITEALMLSSLEYVIDRMTKILCGGHTTDVRQLRAFLMIAKASNDDEPLNQEDLITLLLMSRQAACDTVQRFVRCGVVAREVSTTDRRVKLLVLTDQGREIAQKISNYLERKPNGQSAAA